MGLNTSSTKSGRTFLSIVNGKLAQKATKETPNAVSRINKRNEEVWEIMHDSLSGIIREIKIETKEFPSGKTKQLEIEMSDGDDKFTITIPVDSKHFDHFCSKIGSANISKPVEIKPYSFIPKGEKSKKSGLNIFQDDKKVPYFFSPENPMGKPFPPADRMDDSVSSTALFDMNFETRSLMAVVGFLIMVLDILVC